MAATTATRQDIALAEPEEEWDEYDDYEDFQLDVPSHAMKPATRHCVSDVLPSEAINTKHRGTRNSGRSSKPPKSKTIPLVQVLTPFADSKANVAVLRHQSSYGVQHKLDQPFVVQPDLDSFRRCFYRHFAHELKNSLWNVTSVRVLDVHPKVATQFMHMLRSSDPNEVTCALAYYDADELDFGHIVAHGLVIPEEPIEVNVGAGAPFDSGSIREQGILLNRIPRRNVTDDAKTVLACAVLDDSKHRTAFRSLYPNDDNEPYVTEDLPRSKVGRDRDHKHSQKPAKDQPVDQFDDNATFVRCARDRIIAKREDIVIPLFAVEAAGNYGLIQQPSHDARALEHKVHEKEITIYRRNARSIP